MLHVRAKIPGTVAAFVDKPGILLFIFSVFKILSDLLLNDTIFKIG
ncbi:MAG: hypothetical protein U9O54_03060 [Chloroflexota bacterium]|nr:hypothetical protein [Chloroflexota bacterium]